MGPPRVGRRGRRHGDGHLGGPRAAAADGAHRLRAAPARPHLRPLRGAAAPVLRPVRLDADDAPGLLAAGASDQRDQRGGAPREAGGTSSACAATTTAA
ncbi:hypothetical protein [Nocardioides sp. B-3]|uniref:hypothetical protein n=1 Tax=Nocardioides sp. B-3 TaxID=2895565 RepID=UPI0021523EE9|nr:hypothetical protein [Nocardioides sp. B-3]UUZ58898.1 hypothetical protein LP418_23015 [Nocardioides sp. B-3]